MSRFRIGLMTVVLLALVPRANACPGLLGIGLPLLFGTEMPVSPWSNNLDARPVVDLAIPRDSEEAQDAPPARRDQAVECLKSWKQLVREGRFEQAMPVAAKAAALDPTNLDCQHAVIVSQALKAIGELPVRPTVTTTSSAKTSSCCSAAAVATVAADCARKCSGEVAKTCPGECPASCKTVCAAQGTACPESCPSSCPTTCLPACEGCPLKLFTAAPVAIELEMPLPKMIQNWLRGDHTGVTFRAQVTKPCDARAQGGLAQGGLVCGEIQIGVSRCCEGDKATIVRGVAQTSGEIRLASHAVTTTTPKRVQVATAGWTAECDTIADWNGSEMVMEGNVRLTSRRLEMTVNASRVRVNLTTGSVQVDNAK